MHEEVRIITSEGTVHRGFRTSDGVLFTAEADNLDQATYVVGIVSYIGAVSEGSTQGDDYCGRCFPNEAPE